MPDISMCENRKCPKRNKCYRFRAVPDIGQSYCTFNDPLDGDCQWFMPIEKGDKVMGIKHPRRKPVVKSRQGGGESPVRPRKARLRARKWAKMAILRVGCPYVVEIEGGRVILKPVEGGIE